MKKPTNRLFTIDLDVYEEASHDLTLYHELLMGALEEAEEYSKHSPEEVDPEMLEDLRMQADMVGEIILKFKTSVINGSQMNPGGNPKIH